MTGSSAGPSKPKPGSWWRRTGPAWLGASGPAAQAALGVLTDAGLALQEWRWGVWVPARVPPGRTRHLEHPEADVPPAGLSSDSEWGN